MSSRTDLCVSRRAEDSRNRNGDGGDGGGIDVGLAACAPHLGWKLEYAVSSACQPVPTVLRDRKAKSGSPDRPVTPMAEAGQLPKFSNALWPKPAKAPTTKLTLGPCLVPKKFQNSPSH